MTWYYPTNRHNAIEVLTRALLHPRLEGDKYYRDLLEVAQGLIPLTTGPIPAALASWLAEDGEASFPVMIELPKLKRSASGDASGAFVGFRGALPVVAPTVHLHEENARAEFIARTYQNIDPATIQTKVTPELFEDPGELAGSLQALAALPGPHAELNREFSIADAVAAAGVMAFNASSDYQSVTAAAESLNVLLDGEPSVDTLVALFLTLSGPSNSDDVQLLETLSPRFIENGTAMRDSPVAFVTELEEALGSGTKPEDELSSNLARVRSIVSGDARLERFREGSGLITAKALLLFLLRPEPESVTGWAKEDVGADATTLGLASAFAGAARGYRGLSPDCRGSEQFRALIANAGADLVNKSPESKPTSFTSKGKFTGKAVEDNPGIVGLQLSRVGKVLAERTVNEPGLRGKLLRQPHFTPDDKAIALAIVRRMGWTDCLETILEVQRFETIQGERSLELIIDGQPRVRQEVKIELFKKGLQQVTTQEIEAIVRAEVDDADTAPLAVLDGQGALEL